MPTATVRYGRPKGSGLDDRQQLETLAALLAANPKLKPTTAIRSLGVEDPSAIRRLRDKFRLEQAKLMADAARATRASSQRSVRASSNESVPASVRSPSRALVPVKPAPREIAPVATTLLTHWCDAAFSMLSATAGAQAMLAQQWLNVPPVANAVRRQMALNAMAVAFYTRRRDRRRTLH